MFIPSKNIYKSLIPLTIGIGINFIALLPVAASKVRALDSKIASSETISTVVAPGKSTPISFNNDEVITFVLLSDQSSNVYTLNAPIESGQAKSIFLRQIETLDIPGTTKSDRPNLFVVTTDSQGKQKQYEFSIHNANSSVDNDRISIIEKKKPEVTPPKTKPQNVIVTSLGEATPSDIKLGLETKLRLGSLSPEDPIIYSVAECIALAMNGTPMAEAANSFDVPLSVLIELGSLGLSQKTRQRLTPLPKTIRLQHDEPGSLPFQEESLR